MTFTRAAALWSLVLALGSADAAVTVKVVDLPTRGVTIRVGYVKPDAPIATLIAYPGGNGISGIGVNFAGDPLSFAFANRGIAVAYVDAPSDLLSTGLTREFRQSPEHAADALEVIKFVRQQADVPVWLGGISNGTVSVTYFGINLPSDLPFGLILASSRTVDGNLAYSVFHMDLESIRRPTLVLAHAEDPCNVTPPRNAPLLFARLTSAPGKDLVFVTGGVAGLDPCNGGHHLFEGQDDEVAATISAFISKYNGLLDVAKAPATVVAVEFYHRRFDHYFITTTDYPQEISDLDTGVHEGWEPTNLSFNVFAAPGPGTSPVCRFRISPEDGNSHFYGRGTQECDETAQKFPTYTNEKSDFFHVILPVLGVCPPGTINLYRVFSERPGDSNHRYTIDPAVRDLMAAMQPHPWKPEGDGDDVVAMCVPPTASGASAPTAPPAAPPAPQPR